MLTMGQMIQMTNEVKMKELPIYVATNPMLYS